MITAEDIFKLVFFIYWGAMLSVIGLVWLFAWKLVSKGNKWWVGLLGTAAAAAVFVLPMFKQDVKAKQEDKELQVRQEKYLAAKAVFDERCKDAGYKIYKTVENVEGVTLLNVWQGDPRNEDQMWEYAGLPKASGKDGYIQGFLFWREWDFQTNDYSDYSNGFVPNLNYQHKNLPNEVKQRYKNLNSYKYVDVAQNSIYQRYQYKELYDPSEISITTVQKPSRYTVEFENPIIPEDRKIWMTTTKAFVRDTKTGTLLGEATWYSLHGGQGVKKYSTTGIWDRAKVCPDIANGQYGPIQYFVLKVLKPKQFPPQLQSKPEETNDVETLKPKAQ